MNLLLLVAMLTGPEVFEASGPVTALPEVYGATAASKPETPKLEVRIVLLTASWCGPCVQLKPILKKIVDESQGTVVVEEIDTDKNPKAVETYKCRGIPMLIFFRGEAKESATSQVGLTTRQVLLQKIQQTKDWKEPR